MHKQNNNKTHIPYLIGVAVFAVWVTLLTLLTNALTANAEEDETHYYKFNTLYESEKTIMRKDKTIETKLNLAIMENGTRTVDFDDRSVTYTKYVLFADATSAGTVGATYDIYESTTIATGEVTDYGAGKTTTLGYMTLEQWQENVEAGKDVTNIGIERSALTTDIPIFGTVDGVKHYFETGELPETEVDTGEIPIPQLTTLSHNGFKVANAAEDLELDLVVESKTYGLKHKNHKSTNIITGADDVGFERDETQLIEFRRYDCTSNSEVGYYKDSYSLSEDFGCSNVEDLFNDVYGYFTKYPYNSKLPDYNFFYHAGTANQLAYEAIKDNIYSNYSGGITGWATAMNQSCQAETKYYVRFYKLTPTSTGYMMTPGEWQCYTFNGLGKIGTSPVIGDPREGVPIETNPIWGDQDEDGNPNYGDGGYDFAVNTSNPLEMITSFLEFVKQLPDMLGELSDFLAEAFKFIPQKFWDIINVGVGFSVVFLIFRAIK